MGMDLIPAQVVNNTSDLVLVIVDGNNWGTFYQVAPGESSRDYVWSVDGFGAYKLGTEIEARVTFNGHVSGWWRLHDGTTAHVGGSSGSYFLNSSGLPFTDPSPQTANDYQFDPYTLDHCT